MEYILKNPRDTRDYVIKMERWLRGKEEIAFASASVRPSSMVIERVKFTRTAVVIRVSGGGASARHMVAIEITTTVGQVKVVQFGIATRGDAAKPSVLPLVSVDGSMTFLDYGPDLDLEPDISVSGSMVIFSSEYGNDPDPGEDPSSEPYPLSVVGRRVTRPNGEAVRLKAINWFGMEGAGRAPGGLTVRSYKALIDQVVAWGFNTLRLPFAGDSFSGADATGIDLALNPDLESSTPGVAKKPLEILDAVIAYAATKSVMVVLDHHRRAVGSGADGSPISPAYTKAQWLASWSVLAARYKDIPSVIGADLHNAPADHSWAEWAELAEDCANAIHLVAPGWLAFAQGVATYDGRTYWPGGQLGGVLTRPIRITRSNKLVYAAHDYGQSMGAQPWLSTAAQPVANYPHNLPAVFQAAWGFILEQGIGPVWVNEFGGNFGIGSDGTVMPSGELEKQWAIQLEAYLMSNEGSFGYWSLNPDSAETGGLLQNDWETTQGHKLSVLLPILTGTQ